MGRPNGSGFSRGIFDKVVLFAARSAMHAGLTFVNEATPNIVFPSEGSTNHDFPALEVYIQDNGSMVIQVRNFHIDLQYKIIADDDYMFI
jgi:hypothetical protein